jgi:copper ion binding protein
MQTETKAGERIDLPVTGMTCAACARRVETRLSRAPGVREAGVNFATGRATVEYDPDSTGLRALMDAVEEAGYGTTGTTRAVFVVDDSARPGGSADPLERHLGRVRGVVSAGFNLATREVRVEYLAGTTDAAELGRAIEDFGYRVRAIPGDGTEPDAGALEEEAREEEYRALRRRFLVAAVLALPVLVMAMSHGRIAWLDFAGAEWVQLLLTTPVVLYAGAPFYRGAWAAFRHRAADMNTLIAVGTGTAYLYSVAATHGARLLHARRHWRDARDGRARGAASVLRGGGGHHRAHPAGAPAGGARQGPHRRGHPPPDGPAAPHRPRRPGRRRIGRPRRRGGGGRPGGGAARRPGPGGRRGGGRRVRGGRVDAHRREPAGGEDGRRRGVRRNDEPHRRLPLPRHQGGA